MREFFLQNKKFLYATSVLIGTMVGVGIFGIPFAMAKAGFVVGLGFLIFAGLITLTFTLVFAEIVLRTHQRHQLVGYTNLYLGPFFKRIVFFANAAGIYGALLAYIIVAGQFADNIFSSFLFFSTDFYSFVFAVIASFLILLGLRAGAWIEMALTTLFVLVMLVIFGVGVGKVELINLTTLNPTFWFLPYGVLLFAFAGLTSVPLLREVLFGQEKKIRQSVYLATGIVAVLYVLFSLTVVGVSGELTSPDALSGLLDTIGPKIILLGSVFGILAMFTSFTMLGLALRDIFHLDYRVKPLASWALVVVPPLIFFVAGMRNFIDVISLIGSVAIGLESVILIFVLQQARRYGDRKPEFVLRAPLWILYLLIPIFLSGVVYDIIIH